MPTTLIRSARAAGGLEGDLDALVAARPRSRPGTSPRARPSGSGRRRPAGGRSPTRGRRTRRSARWVISRVGDVVRDAAGSAATSQRADAVEHARERGPRRRGHLRERARALVPGVAERRVAVADVRPRPVARADAVRERAAARDDEPWSPTGRRSGGRGNSGSSRRKLLLAIAPRRCSGEVRTVAAAEARRHVPSSS